MSETIHLKYALALSGAAETGHCSPDAIKMAEEIGKSVAKNNCILVTGATTGIPYWAAKGAKEAGGIVFGLSPASSEKEHIKKYHLPVDYHDCIIYTGSGYSGRNLLLMKSAHGLIFICGRMGTLNEFTIGFEDEKPLAILEGSGGTADKIRKIVEEAHRGPGKIVYEKDPQKIVPALLALVKKQETEDHAA